MRMVVTLNVVFAFSLLCVSFFTFTFARLSVTFVRPTQAIFRQYFYGIRYLGHPPLKISRRSSQGNPSAGWVKHEGQPSIAILDLSTAISRKRRKIEGKLLLTTNRKSYMSFRLVSKSVTLNDLERLNGRYFALFQRIRVASRAHCIKVHVRYLIS